MQSSARRKPEVGKIYNIRTSWGRGVTVRGKVTEFISGGHGGHHQKDIVDYVVVKEAPGYPVGATHWAYIHQIEGFENA